MIKEFILKLEELEEDITVTFSESEQDYDVRIFEPLTVSQLNSIIAEINKIIPQFVKK